jgi:hypothetical protein
MASRVNGGRGVTPTFWFLEREFKQRLPVFVSNDYPPAVGGVIVQEFPVQGSAVQKSPIHDLSRALRCLYFSVHSTSKLDAFLVEYGHLAPSHVEVEAWQASAPCFDIKDGRAPITARRGTLSQCPQKYQSTLSYSFPEELSKTGQSPIFGG